MSAAIAACLWGCASTPPEFTLTPGAVSAADSVTWPLAPEIPRYAYAGELVGEGNFVQRAPKRSAFVRALRAVVGLDEDNGRPKVLMRPQSGMVDAAGRILVTDVGRGGVFVFDAKAGDLVFWDQADNGAGFVSPLGIAPGPGGEIHVADAELKRVVRLDATGRPIGAFGAGVLERPTGLARDTVRGLTYVADTGAHDIKVFDDQRNLVRRLGGPGVEPGRFNRPTFLAMQGDALVVSDTLNARVQVISTDGVPEREIGRRGIYVGNLVRPKGVATDRDGNVYVVEGYHDHLLVFDARGQLLLPIGGTGNGPGKFFLPGGVWSDGSDRIFLADVFNGRVVVFRYLGAQP